MVPMSVSDGSGRMPTWVDVRAFAAHAEAVDLDSVWVCDHFLSGGPGLEPEGIHEGWTILSALAASTSRVELGQLVTCVSFRNPALLAKIVNGADTDNSLWNQPEAAGLNAIAEGFRHIGLKDDHGDA